MDAKMRLTLIVLVILLLEGMSAGLEDQAKIYTSNGHIIFEPARDKNITFTVRGAGYVNVGHHTLDQMLQTVAKMSTTTDDSRSSDGGQLVGESASATEQLQLLITYINGPFGLLKQLEHLEQTHASATVNASVMSTRLDLLTRRIKSVELQLETLQTSLDADQCASGPCQNGGTCLSAYNSFRCLCPANWQGQTCAKDVNECEQLAGTGLGCQNGATCQNRPGGYSSLCADGWRGIHCNTRTQDCTTAGAELCSNGLCVQLPNGGFRCACAPGWKTNGLTPACTVDVDECEGPRAHCSLEPAVECINLPGSYTCGPCPAGYTGTGFYCVDIDECETNNGGCSTGPSVPCINTRGSFRCGSCPVGYAGDGRTCVAQTSPRCTPDQCHPMARCVDYGSVPGCVCQPGYTGSGYGSSGCARIEDPCASAPCQNGGSCVATNGTSFSCRCSSGTDLPHCRPSRPSPCEPSPCQNGGTCERLEGQRDRLVCRCSPGYTGLHCQTEVQECDGERYQLAGTLHYPEVNETVLGRSTRCAWLIKTNEKFTLNVTFSQFQLGGSQGECKSEWLQLHDGHSRAAPIIGRYCGTGLPNGTNGHLTSTSNTLYLWFHSQNPSTNVSFTLHWESVEAVCGGRITVQEHGTLQWPQDDDRDRDHQPHWDCRWHLQTEPGRRLQFSFVTLRLPKSESGHCSTHFVQLTDGIDEERGTVLGKYCGTESHPSPLTTTASEATLYFHSSDDDDHEMSFTVRYTVVEADCGGIYTQLVGTIASTTPQIDDEQPQHWPVCEYRITLPVGTRVELRIVQLLGSCTDGRQQLELFDGPSTVDPFVGQFCGDQLPPGYRLTSTTNVLLIRFRRSSDHRRPEKEAFRLSYAMKCGGTFTNPDLPLISPGYPSLYPGEQVCDYTIHAPLGSIITFEFVDLDLGEGCEWGYIVLDDGLSRNLLASGCNHSIPSQIRSNGNVLRMRYVLRGYRSDGRGFKGWFHFTDVGCGGVLMHDTDPIIHSPAIAETDQRLYQRNGRCEWLLEAPAGHTILLSWDSFALEPPRTIGGPCRHQYVEVYEPDSTETGNKRLGQYCGTQLPPTMSSAGELLTVRFVTNATVPPRDSFAFKFTFIETEHSCGGAYSGTSGTIKTPGWPSRYPPNRNCVWTIDVPMGHQIRLLVHSFDVERQDSGCWFDGLTIRNGGTDQSPLIGTFCGTMRRNPSFNGTISSGHQLYLHFFSDGTDGAPGFHLEWDASATGCGGVLTAPSGMIISPNYPLAYGHNGSCSWRIIVSQGSTIRFSLTSLQLPDNEPCRHDYLDVYDGTDAGGHRLDRFCGLSTTEPIALPSTTTNHAYLRLQSTDTYQGEGGFRLEYELDCRQHNITTGRRGIIESPNFPDRYPPGLDCQWTIRVPRGNRIRLEFILFRIDSVYGDATSSTASQHCPVDYLEVRQRDASASGDPPIRQRYCTAHPRRFVSLGNTIELRFHSASNGSSGNERYGFQLEWSTEGCGGLLTTFRNPGVAEVFNSPGYPDSYPRNTECLWQIVTEVGHQIMLQFEELRMRPNAGCRQDGVMVANDPSFRHPITTICHERGEAPLQFVSNGHELYIKFWSSDSSASSRGFRARYLGRPAECGGTFILPRGVITTPNYPAPYPVNTSCEWLILTELSHTLRLTFEELVLEPSDNCTNDALKVYEGNVPATEHLLLEACGAGTAVPNIVSVQHAMLVTFRSNDLYSYKGFRASYITDCGARIVVNKPGSVSLDTAHMLVATKECSWVLTAPEETERITLSFVHVSIGNVTMEVLDGDVLTSGGAVRYTGRGYHIPSTIVSSGNALTVRIRSTDISLTELNNLFLEFTYTTLENACGGRLDALTGIFASPNFPNSYPAGVECVWEVRVSPGNQIWLEIPQLDIVPTDGCNGDYLEVRESTASGRLLGDFCGVEQPPLMTSDNDATGFWIKFRSSGPTVAKGFLALYSYESVIELEGSGGLITSPLYPRSYYAPRSISWRVSVPDESVVAISFNNFAIDHSSDLPDLCDGSLVIYDGYDDDAPVLLTACGYIKPDPLTTSTNVVYIQLDHTNARGPSNFSLQWHQQVVGSVATPTAGSTNDTEPCTSNRLLVLDSYRTVYNISSPGFPYGYAPNLACRWTFQSALRSFHPVLQLVVVDLERTPQCLADYVEVEDSSDLAVWLPRGRICRSDEDRPPAERNWTEPGQPGLRLNFRTDSYNNRTGFLATVRLRCSSHLTASSGVIELEPGAPGAASGCTWLVTVRTGRQIEFEFERLNLTDGWIRIRNGQDNWAPVIGLYRTGTSTVPGLERTTSNTATVEYTPNNGTNASQADFRLLYREVSLECGGKVLLDRDFEATNLRTPYYPSRTPPPYLDCVWQILATAAGQLLRLELHDTTLFSSPDCDRHYLEILDGPTESAPVLQRLCRSFTAQQFISTTNGMRVRYFNERSEGTKPLKLRVSMVRCGRSSRSLSGTISSENYPTPGAYPVPAVCEYHIIPPVLASLRFTFDDLHLPGNPANGCNDSSSVSLYGVMALASDDGSHRVPLGTFCGTTVPPPIDSPVSNVVVIFRTLQTREPGEYRGFKLAYSTDHGLDCTHRIVAPAGEVSNPGYSDHLVPRKHCVWRITVPPGRRLKIEFLDLDPTILRTPERIPQTLLLFYDGHTVSQERRQLVLIQYEAPQTGGLPAPIYSSSNELMIRYYSLRELYGHGAFRVRFSSEEPSRCVGSLNGQAGTIETPADGSRLVCTYRRTDRSLIPGHAGGTLALSFREVVADPALECIEVFGARHLLRKLCSNSTNTLLVLSPFPDTLIELRRSAAPRWPPVGFMLDYRVYECGGRFAGATITNISLSSSSNSSTSGDQWHCAWQVLYPEGTQVEIGVVRFELRLPCDREYLEIFNGPLPTSPRIGATRYCRDTPIAIGQPIVTHRHELYVEYHGADVGSFELALTGKPYVCGGTLHPGTATFGAPLNGSRYPANVECVWLLQAPPGHHVGFRFVGRFSIEKSTGCTKDYVELFDQQQQQQQRTSPGEWRSLGRVCGKVPVPVGFNSTGTVLKVVFRTDNATESDGFTARWDANCGGMFYAEQEPQLIVSPNYPEPYGPNLHCSYTIAASPYATDRHIELRFGRFELAELLPFPLSTCRPDSSDIVELYRREERSTDPNSWQLAASYCSGNAPMAPFRALDRIRIVFRSDSKLEAAGFTFEYRLEACGGNITASQRIQSPPGKLPDEWTWNPSSFYCRWYLAIPPGQKVTVRFEQLDLRHSTDCRDDAIEVYRGLELTERNRLVKLCGNLTGQAPVVPIRGSHGIISYRIDQQQPSTSSSPLVALILYGPDCDRSITLDDRSPRYELSAEGDADAQDCHYTFQVPTGYTVQISFNTPFHLETARNASDPSFACSDDYVELHDGLSALSPLLGRYCGTRVPPVQHSSGPWLHLRYVTDSALRRGMRLEATVTMESSLCGPLEHELASGVEVEVSAPPPAITPDDEQPGNRQRCFWVFRVAPDHQIELHFRKFDLAGYDEDADGCQNYIGIRDATHESIIYEGLGESLVYHGRTVNSVNFTHGVSYPTAYHKYCGGSDYLPSPYISLTNEVFVEFQRKRGIGGALLSVRQSGSGCAQHYTALQGRILRKVPVRGQQPCTITIEVPKNYTIAVYFNSFRLEQVECPEHAIRVYDGASERPERLLASYCRAVRPNPVFSTGRVLYFVLPPIDSANATLLLDATYVASKDGPGCGGVLYNYGGYLTSPHYPNSNRAPVKCTWHLIVPDNLVIAVHFDVLDLGSDRFCDTDYVQLIEKHLSDQDVKHGRRYLRQFCDSEHPLFYATQSNELDVFYSGSVRSGGRGWKMRFIAVQPDDDVTFPMTFG